MHGIDLMGIGQSWRGIWYLILFIGCYSGTLGTLSVKAQSIPFLIGGYADGIYLSRLDLETGSMQVPVRVAAIHAPAFLAVHPKLPIVLSVSETNRGHRNQPPVISAFAWSPLDENLRLINQQPIDGDAPCYVSTDSEGRVALVANYSSGSVMVYPISPTGELLPCSDTIQHPPHRGPNAQRQEGPHAHSILQDPSGKWVAVADLGLDQVRVYSLDRDRAKMIPADPPGFDLPPGSGPRHLAFHPNGKWVFIINELTSTLTTATWDSENGKMSAVQTVSTVLGDLPENNSTAEVLVHPNGKFVYGSNRVHDSIAVFQFDERSGKTTLVQNQSTGGKIPRNFRLDPEGRYLLAENQVSGTIRSFRIQPDDGTLRDTGHVIEVPSPACIKFVEPR